MVFILTANSPIPLLPVKALFGLDGRFEKITGHTYLFFIFSLFFNEHFGIIIFTGMGLYPQEGNNYDQTEELPSE